jgi:RNA polymerase sigma-70 factor (ECF subfamily)
MAWRISQGVSWTGNTATLDSRVSASQLTADDPRIVDLVDRAVRRDQAAFAELYDLHVSRVYRYAFYRTGKRSDAEDVTDQVFLQAWAAIDRFRWKGKPFVAWLYVLAHNAVIDWRRRAAPSESLDDSELPLRMASEEASLELTRWMDTELLAGAISHLTPDQQQVIILKFVDGLDTAEVARLMNRREGTIRALQMRALQSLRRVLERQGESSAV